MRAQSHVVGVALMLGLAVLALGTLTVGIGSMVDEQASNADATRVAEDLVDALEAVERTGRASHEVAFTAGTLTDADRTMRLIENGTVIATQDVDAILFESGDRRVAVLAGAVVRGQRGNAWFVEDPPIASSNRTNVLVVGAPVLDTDHVSLGGQGGVATTLQTTVSHSETDLGTGQFSVAIETETPGPFERYFRSQGATTERRTFAGDEQKSVVAHYPGQRRTHLVVHDLGLEVGDG